MKFWRCGSGTGCAFSVKQCPRVLPGDLDCLKTQLDSALGRELAENTQKFLMGQIVLRDRVLRYRADAHRVVWSQIRIQAIDLLAAAATLERDAGSSSTSQASVDQAARRLGDVLMDDLHAPSAPDNLLLLEPDPLLGNVPWPAVETAERGNWIALQSGGGAVCFLDHQLGTPEGTASAGRPLVVGASVGAGESEFLPEVLNEARTVARLGSDSDLLLAGQATEARVAAHLSSASMIHFAGHALHQWGDAPVIGSLGRRGRQTLPRQRALSKRPTQGRQACGLLGLFQRQKRRGLESWHGGHRRHTRLAGSA